VQFTPPINFQSPCPNSPKNILTKYSKGLATKEDLKGLATKQDLDASEKRVIKRIDEAQAAPLQMMGGFYFAQVRNNARTRNARQAGLTRPARTPCSAS
jgi:hypothetical protein